MWATLVFPAQTSTPKRCFRALHQQSWVQRTLCGTGTAALGAALQHIHVSAAPHGCVRAGSGQASVGSFADGTICFHRASLPFSPGNPTEAARARCMSAGRTTNTSALVPPRHGLTRGHPAPTCPAMSSHHKPLMPSPARGKDRKAASLGAGTIPALAPETWNHPPASPSA